MKSLLFLFLACLAGSAGAHEFWGEAEPFRAAPNEPVAVRLRVGEYFNGDVVPIARPQAAMLKLVHDGEEFDIRQQLPAERALPEMKLALPAEGAWMLAFDSYPSSITLPAEKFHAYLHDEGLDAIIRKREADGKQNEPGREHYRRNVKIMMRAGSQASTTHAARTGQRFEIVPAEDPTTLPAGSTLHLQLLFDGKPASGVLLKAWHRHERQVLMIRATTDAQGKTSVSLPYAGMWMLSAVHMLPAGPEAKEADWDSFWANLSFALPEK
ncbi:DUF4198 domain-containing protein [Noviherbaspirillum galbum]|uniref:DUF4198 domain-containing protein n=1 Tax=Noviherbaspirillum galbum TaxID=2709383 RepID=A0A6B3SQY6_9BURK|nr:DUF4198 domain-containing protein [Noviherbaspirillum galbum]NEX63177.1 DUF4198 domain-containing protein [Noviherbaspirillum galbum]